MDARDPELQKELAATIHARKDLGEEYESALIDSFMEKMDKRLDSHVERQVRRELAQQQTSFARAGSRVGPRGAQQPGGRTGRFGGGFAAISLVAAIPLSAIAGGISGLPGLLVAWVGIVGVNAAQSLGWLFAERPAGGKSDDAWED
jgi:anti-sigma factor RsiW